jgi:lipopolysaccharide export system protein LptA
MNKRICTMLVLAAAGAVVWAEPKPQKAAPETSTEIRSNRAVFDNTSRRLVYTGDVVVTDAKVRLTCDQLTVNLPPTGQNRPTNILAEVNPSTKYVVIDFVDDNGMTNHLTANRAVYEFMVVNGQTNWTVTFTGKPNDPPRVETPEYICTSDPLVRDIASGQYHFTNPDMVSKKSMMSSTNGLPSNLLK